MTYDQRDRDRRRGYMPLPSAARARRAAANRHDGLKLAGAALAIIAVIALIGAGIYYGVKDHNAHVNNCHDRGGRVSHHTTYYSDHHGHTDSDTTYYCFTDHGQIDQW